MDWQGFEQAREQLSDSPVLLTNLEAILIDLGAEERRSFLRDVDESSFSLREWIEAIIVLGQWLDVRGFELSVRDRIGYVGCAEEAAEGGASLADLPSVVREFLDDFGCERATKK